MRTQTSDERRNQIVRLLLDDGTVKIGQLSRKFSVSTETIRKDLIELEKQGLAKKGHGIAFVANMGADEIVPHAAESQMRLADKAFELIADHATIILDSGSTCYLLARKIIDEKKKVTVITNSIMIAKVLGDSDIDVNIIGGEVSHRQTTTNLWATYCLSLVNADAAFLETTGFKGRKGPCADNFADAQVKRAMIKCARKIYVLAEGMKAQEDSLVEYAAWENFDALITDSFISTDGLELLNGLVEIMLVY